MEFITVLVRFARRLRVQAISAGRWTLLPLVLLQARLISRSTIRSVSPLRSGLLGPKLAILCHFDRAGRLREDLRHYIAELNRGGFAVILASNSPRLDPAARAFLDRHCAGVILRRNVGFDFAAWKDALHAYDLPRAETSLLLLGNDSLYGPLRPLWASLAAADFSTADLWALTDSWQVRYHLQSYLLMAGPNILQSRAWREFWRRVHPLASKYWVIRRYEIGLSQAMLRAGFRLAALWPYTALLEGAASEPASSQEAADPLLAARQRQQGRIREAMARGRPLNPTSDLWRTLLARGFPFLKRELLRENPTAVADLWEWRAMLALEAELDPALILADLARSARNRAP